MTSGMKSRFTKTNLSDSLRFATVTLESYGTGTFFDFIRTTGTIPSGAKRPPRWLIPKLKQSLTGTV